MPAVAPRGVTSTAGAGDALAAAFMHVYAATGDPHAAIAQSVVFAGYAVGAEPGGSVYLTGPQLAEMAPQLTGHGQRIKKWLNRRSCSSALRS